MAALRNNVKIRSIYFSLTLDEYQEIVPSFCDVFSPYIGLTLISLLLLFEIRLSLTSF